MKRGAPRRRRKAKVLAKTLLATTLTAGVAGTAGATSFDESSFGGDFADDQSSADEIPVGTDTLTEVTGSNVDTPDLDFFKFTGLDPNAPFTVNAVETGGLDTNVTLHGDSGILDGPHLVNFQTPYSFTGTIPASGTLVFEASGGEGISYRVTLNAPFAAAVAEPSTLALTALGAALSGVVARRRRQARNPEVR